MNTKKLLIKFSIGLIAVWLLTNTAYAGLMTSISQYGITWTFSQAHECGQFANGDWWVVGPVNITSITPIPSGGRNGSMVNPMPMSIQSYDDRIGNYNSSGLFTGGTVSANSSVVSTISLAVGGNNREILQTAAVLTVLGSVPPDNGATIFRPPYLGSSKPFYSTNDMDASKLPNLSLVSSAPAASTLPGRNVRVQLDHLPGIITRGMLPVDNMQSYGAANTRDYGINYLLLSLNYSMEYRLPLLINMVQAGIDYYQAVSLGMEWQTNGGHSSGRKLTILFAGHILNNSDMLNIMQTYFGNFAEDCQTFYTTANPPTEWGTGLYETLDPKYGPNYARYGQRHCTNPTNPLYHGEIVRGADSPYSTYWTINSYSWVGQTLAALIYGLKDEWAHDAYFDHEDRYIETKGFTGSWGSAFSDEMWTTYRNNLPSGGGDTLAPSVPGTPVASNITGYTVDLNWTASTDDVGVTSYKVYTNGANPVTVTGTSTTIIGLIPSTQYNFTVSARDAVNNESAQSAAVQVTTNSPDTEAPSIPTGLSEGTITTSTVDLSWNASTDNVGVTGYKVYANGSNPVTVASTSTTIDGLADNTTYTFTVSAIDAASNESAQSSAIQVTTVELTGVTSSSSWQSFTESTQTGTFTATFDAIPNGNGIDAVTGIQNGIATTWSDLACIVRFNTSNHIDARNGGSYQAATSVSYTSGTSYHFRLEINVPTHTYSIYVTPQGQSEITLGTDYAFRTEQAGVTQLTGWSLQAVSGSHTVNNMSFSSSGGGDTEAPSVPTGLAAGTITIGSVALSWNTSTDNVGVTGYKVYTDGSNPQSVTGTSTTISGLNDATSYAFTVSAIDAASNESAQSNGINATTLDGTAPSVPTGLSAGTVTSSSVALSWNASTDNVEVTGYKVYTDGANLLTVAGTSATISGLSAATQYSFTISAYDAASNESAQTSAIQVTTQSGSDPLAANIVGYWPMDQINASITPDESGNNNNGTVSGATLTTGQISSALNFDGSNDKVSLGNLDVTPSSGNDGLTLAAWINPDQWVGAYKDDRIISKSTGTAEQDHYWMLSPIKDVTYTRLRFRLKTGATTTTLISSSGDIQLNTWTHVAATYDGSSMKVYINGTEVGSTSKTGTVAISSSVEATIGINPDNERPFDGQIDEVYILDRALSSQEVSSLMTGMSHGEIKFSTPNETTVNIYPNPLNGNMLNITVNGYDSDMVDITIYDMVGRNLYSKAHNIGQTEIQIPVNNLNNGIYIISVNGVQQKLIVE